MKYYLLTLGLLFATSLAHAQVRFSAGPQAGYMLATANYHYDYPLGYVYSTGYKSGFAAGLVAEVGFGHFALQPAIQFAQKGFTLALAYPPGSSSFRNVDVQYRFDYLTIPLNAVFTQQADGQGVRVFAGPYIGFLLGGKYTADVTYVSAGKTSQETQTGRVAVVADTYTYNASNTDEFYARRLDAGLQGGIGYRYQRLLLQASYSLGLRNVGASYANASPNYGSDPTYHNRVFQFSLAYLFGPKS